MIEWTTLRRLGWSVVAWIGIVGCVGPSPTVARTPQEPAHHPANSVLRPAANPTPESGDGPIRIAVTVDDLPSHGPLPAGGSRLAIHDRLLAAFAAHQVPRVYGFVNARHLADDPSLAGPLKAWVDAGHPLGNHTYSHIDLAAVSVAAYLEDLARNEPILAGLVGAPAPKLFRYPYLLEGTDAASTTAIRKYLAAHDYAVAEVTIDFYDWAWNGPYVRCLERGDTQAVAALERAFLAHARQLFAWSDAAAIAIYGRRIPHVLLLHAGAFDAEMIDALLTLYENNGVEWISLAEALKDPAYAKAPLHNQRMQGTLLELMIEAHDLEHPPWPVHPAPLLDALCRQ